MILCFIVIVKSLNFYFDSSLNTHGVLKNHGNQGKKLVMIFKSLKFSAPNLIAYHENTYTAAPHVTVQEIL